MTTEPAQVRNPAANKAALKASIAEKRKNRTPLDGNKQMLAAEIPPGYVGRWFNDRKDRLQRCIAGGWEFITADRKGLCANTDDLGNMMRMRVDRGLTNEPLYAYLMVIEKELYDEDQAKKLDAIAETEKEIIRGTDPRLEGNIDGDLVYVKGADLRGKPM